MSLVGIDVGTSGCKVAAYSLDGKLLAEARHGYDMIRTKPQWAELDPVVVGDAALTALRDIAPLCRMDPVDAISVSSMGEAMVPLAADDTVLAGSILMVDERGGEYAEELGNEIGVDTLYRINPNILSPNYSYPKMAWLRDNEPSVYGDVDCFMLLGDYVLFLLGGGKVTSFSLANRTLLFDIRAEDWSERILRAAGIERDKLPTPVATGTECGRMSEGMAESVGLTSRPLLVVGAHDQCCNSLGSGITEAGRASCGIGTVECIAPTYDHIPDEEVMRKAGLNIEHHAVPGLYTSFIYNQAGSLINWFTRLFPASRDSGFDQFLSTLQSEVPAEPTGLLVLPYLEMTGAPTFESGGLGSILGLRTTTTRGEIYKALMEGETFYFVESIEKLRRLGVDTSEFIATGGGAKSDTWLQIKADIFGVPFIRPEVTEAGALGAAIIAGEATGAFSSLEEAVELFVQHDRVFVPDEERHEIYVEKHHRYTLLHPSVSQILRPIT